MAVRSLKYKPIYHLAMSKGYKLIKKALGVDNHVNFLYIKKNSKKFHKCMNLVERGLMGYAGETASSGSSYFFVTPEGRLYYDKATNRVSFP